MDPSSTPFLTGMRTRKGHQVGEALKAKGEITKRGYVKLRIKGIVVTLIVGGYARSRDCTMHGSADTKGGGEKGWIGWNYCLAR
eukprot:scaffold29742_cov80-Cyclotella_meneghiniana.AAC.3